MPRKDRKNRKMVSEEAPSPSKIVYTYGAEMVSAKNAESEVEFEGCVAAVEKILGYSFKDKGLLKDALTHSSYPDAPSYQRLEFIGDAALGLAVSNFLYLTYPDLDPGQLSLLRAANISTEKLARVAVRHGFHKYVRHNNGVALCNKVSEFVLMVEEEDGTVVHGGLMKAPKVLADIVESVAAAVYVDCGFNLQKLWVIFGGLLEPLVMLDVLAHKPQPITMLFEACQKEGKQIDIRHWRKGERNIASVYVDGRFIASGSSEQKENAKLHAAEAALHKLECFKASNATSIDQLGDFNGGNEIEGAKQKVNELCAKKKWPIPKYEIVDVLGLEHEKRYICSIQLQVSDCILQVTGDERSRLKDAKTSAATMLLRALKESKYI